LLISKGCGPHALRGCQRDRAPTSFAPAVLLSSQARRARAPAAARARAGGAGGDAAAAAHGGEGETSATPALQSGDAPPTTASAASAALVSGVSASGKVHGDVMAEAAAAAAEAEAAAAAGGYGRAMLQSLAATSLGLFQLKGIAERIEVFHCTCVER
jgi:hypothetical protein